MANEEDFKIARFIDLSTCKKVFPDKSFLDYGTFVLRSPEYYRNIEDKKKRDRDEDRIQYINEFNQRCEDEGGWHLISCWTVLEGDKPSDDEWSIFDDSHIMALISTPEKVAKCIKKKLILDKGNSLCWKVTHEKVEYYPKWTRRKLNDTFDGLYKNDYFLKEKEYRFVVNVRNHVDTLMFYADPEEYCDTARINTKTVKCLDLYKAWEDGEIDPNSRSFIENFIELVKLEGKEKMKQKF